ncbi:MAG TPA: NAD(P)-dependent oxidoreductase [Alphaproteobacteria bacterium]|nr:NAD(P)-dependent oxidoreductase [Alphaproteobacteria bacterium]
MRLLITGAAGRIGRALRAGLAGRYQLMRLTDIAPMTPAGPGEECVTADICDRSSMERLCSGIDCVVHLAGISEEPASWEQVLPANIVGTYHVFEAARRAGVHRLVYASSNHVVGFYRRDRAIGTQEPIRPDGVYALSKCFGEALGRLYADKHGLSVACLRIGSFRERPEDRRQAATWLSPRDGVQLVRRCIDAPYFRFLVLYGVSGNLRNFWRNEDADMIGYEPEDSVERLGIDAETEFPPEDPVAEQFHGGSYCVMGLTSDPAKID